MADPRATVALGSAAESSECFQTLTITRVGFVHSSFLLKHNLDCSYGCKLGMQLISCFIFVHYIFFGMRLAIF